MSAAQEEGVKAENEILELESESSKLVQNIIQTAVDQFVRTEDTVTDMLTSDLQTEVHQVTVDSQAAGQKPEKAGSDHQVCAQEVTLVLKLQRSQSSVQWDRCMQIPAEMPVQLQRPS